MLALGIGFLLRRRAFRWRRWCWAWCWATLLDKSLRRGLVLSDGSLLPFFTRPISAVLGHAVHHPAVRARFKAGAAVRRPAPRGALRSLSRP
jgi:TctA family transporter